MMEVCTRLNALLVFVCFVAVHQEVAESSPVEADACREYVGLPCLGSKGEF